MSYRIRTSAYIPKMEDPSLEQVDREMHGGFIRSVGHLPKVPSDGWYELRRKREKWWSNLLRHTDELIAADVPVDRIVLLPAIWKAYIVDCCINRDADKYAKAG